MRTLPRATIAALALGATALAAELAAGVGGGRAAAAQAPERPAASADSAGVNLRWLSITNWLIEAGDTRILLDGYLTRVDRRLLEADGTSRGTAVTDTAELRRLLVRALPDLRLDWILVGHGHWDHAFDVPAIARLTGARIIGPRTVCHQAVALGMDPSRCTPVEGGEELELGANAAVRVVRWHHSGDAGTEAGVRLSMPLELRAPPPVDPRTGGLRPGFLEDYPNGGGTRAYLLTLETGRGERTVFWSNSGNPGAWDVPVPADTALLRRSGIDASNLEPASFGIPTRRLLAAGLRAEALDRVDVWLGFPGPAHVRQVVPVLRPRVFVPHHWDDFWEPMAPSPGSFDAASIRPFLDSAGVRLVVPARYIAPVDPDLFAPSPYHAGLSAGTDAAGPADEGADVVRFVLAAGTGFAAALTAPLFLLGEPALPLVAVGATVMLAEVGPTTPSPDVVADVDSIGPAYADAFHRGYPERLVFERRRATSLGAGLGAAVGAFVVWSVVSSTTW